MHILLLTHERELRRLSNTGQCLLNDKVPATQIVWQRRNPDEQLLSVIRQGRCALLYPTANAQIVAAEVMAALDYLIIIDATWQEARKIYNQSPYLQELVHLQISNSEPTQYRLRRNQIAQGLCTAECAIRVFDMSGQHNAAKCVQSRFDNLNRL